MNLETNIISFHRPNKPMKKRFSVSCTNVGVVASVVFDIVEEEGNYYVDPEDLKVMNIVTNLCINTCLEISRGEDVRVQKNKLQESMNAIYKDYENHQAKQYQLSVTKPVIY